MNSINALKGLDETIYDYFFMFKIKVNELLHSFIFEENLNE